MAFLALIFRPGQDYAVFGDQIIMDLSQDELVLAKRALAVFKPAIEQASFDDLWQLLALKLELN